MQTFGETGLCRKHSIVAILCPYCKLDAAEKEIISLRNSNAELVADIADLTARLASDRRELLKEIEEIMSTYTQPCWTDEEIFREIQERYSGELNE